MDTKDQVTIKSLPGNDVCADCGASNPEWASVSFATLICIHCSGTHRSLGTHISFVRSVTMDSWTAKQLSIMKLGGNAKCNDFIVKQHGVTTSDIREKYSSPAAQLYKQVLLARYEGKPEPTVLPPPMETSNNKKKKQNYAGFGSSPPPSRRDTVWNKRNLQRSALVMGVVALATTAIFLLPSSHAATVLSTRQIQTFYNTVGPALDLMSIVEDAPRQAAITKAHLDESTCRSVLEIGCGTGRTARSILQHYPNVESYTCMEVSSHMAQLTTDRLKQEQHDATRTIQVWNENALATTTSWPQGVDCILAFYVLDIWSPEDIHVFFKRAREALLTHDDDKNNGGKVVLVSIAMPPSSSNVLARAVMSTWKAVASRFPLLLGGCRPIPLAEFLSQDEWNVMDCEQMSVLGYTSEIVIATPRGEAAEA